MKKKLKLDGLKVQSFVTDEELKKVKGGEKHTKVGICVIIRRTWKRCRTYSPDLGGNRC